jgi:hypothetical protein
MSLLAMPARLEGESLAASTMPRKFEVWLFKSDSSQRIKHSTPGAAEERRGCNYYSPAPDARANMRWSQ